MAHFEGSIKEFNRFFGPYAKLKVAYLSKRHKEKVGKCEECGGSGELDAAHLQGRTRAYLIGNILSEFLEENDILSIDLNEFEQRFIEAHSPIETCIRVLCKACHQKYDAREKTNALKRKPTAHEEGELIEHVVHDQMNKPKAMRLARANKDLKLTSANTIFSNIIAAQEGWWLQPSNDKFTRDLHIMLNDSRSKTLFVFKLPANTITQPSTHFKQRNDSYRSDCSDIYIALSGLGFREKRGFDFSAFLVDKIPCSEPA